VNFKYSEPKKLAINILLSGTALWIEGHRAKTVQAFYLRLRKRVWDANYMVRP